MGVAKVESMTTMAPCKQKQVQTSCWFRGLGLPWSCLRRTGGGPARPAGSAATGRPPPAGHRHRRRCPCARALGLHSATTRGMSTQRRQGLVGDSLKNSDTCLHMRATGEGSGGEEGQRRRWPEEQHAWCLVSQHATLSHRCTLQRQRPCRSEHSRRATKPSSCGSPIQHGSHAMLLQGRLQGSQVSWIDHAHSDAHFWKHLRWVGRAAKWANVTQQLECGHTRPQHCTTPAAAAATRQQQRSSAAQPPSTLISRSPSG